MDPAAALRPAEIEVQLGGWIYTIPELPAADWLEALMADDAGAIIPGLLEEDDQRDIWHQFLTGKIDKEELNQAWRSVLTAAVGQPWWVASRLLLAVADAKTWPIIHGRLIERGVDLESISIGALWNVVYMIARSNCANDNDQAKLEYDLTTPPPEASAEEASAFTTTRDEFLAAMGTLQRASGRAGG
jgi:hypothetical protein